MSKSLELYDSANQLPHVFQEMKDVLHYRYLLVQLIRRDIVTRYKRSFLGVTWTMLNPLGTMIILTIVFSKIFGGSKSYPVFVLSGLLIWNFFSKSTLAAMNNIVWGGSLLKRILLPKTAFSISSIGTELINFLLSLIPLALVILATGNQFYPSMIFIPIILVLLSCFSLGLALLLSTIAIYFPDVSEMYLIILTGWMYLTPIIYSIDVFPQEYRFILWLNPLTYLVGLMHIIVVEGRFPSWIVLWPAIAWSIGILVIGWLVFTNKSDEFAYRV